MTEKQREFLMSLINSKLKTADAKLIAISRLHNMTAAEASDLITELKALPDAGAKEITNGTQKITGTIISRDTKFYRYPGGGIQSTRDVMTVQADGFKAWGTQPASISDARTGDKIEFTATLEASDRDKSFGFFKRPKAAKILTTEEMEMAA